MNSNPAITASRRPRSRATWSDSTPRPRLRGRWQVASTAARSETPNGRACPRPRSPAVRRYPASTRAVRSPAGVGSPASFARKHAAATAIDALEAARPASLSPRSCRRRSPHREAGQGSHRWSSRPSSRRGQARGSAARSRRWAFAYNGHAVSGSRGPLGPRPRTAALVLAPDRRRSAGTRPAPGPSARRLE